MNYEKEINELKTEINKIKRTLNSQCIKPIVDAEEQEIIQGSDKIWFYRSMDDGYLSMIFNSNNNRIVYDSNFYFIGYSFDRDQWFIPRLKKHIIELEIGKWYYICADLSMIDFKQYYHLVLHEDKYCYVDGMNITAEYIDLTDMVVYEVIK